MDGLPYANNYIVSSQWGGYVTGIDTHIVRQWWQGVNFSQLATPITVDASHNPTSDMQMQRGDTISGHVQDQNGNSVVGASVLIYDYNFISGAIHNISVIGPTDASGNFTSWGLPGGTYAVQVTAAGYASQWYKDQYFSVNASQISISGAGDGNHDVVLDPMTLVPPYNQVNANFNTNYNYVVYGDSFTDKQVTGSKNWYPGITNTADNTNNPITSLNATLTSALTFSSIFPTPNSSAPTVPPAPSATIYQWTAPTIQSVISQNNGFSLGMTSGTADYDPGFNVSRTISQQHFTANGQQVITLTVTPVVAMEQMNITISAPANNWLNPTIVTPASGSGGPGINIKNNVNNLGININPVVKDYVYTFTITINVALNPGVTSVDYTPTININQQTTQASGGSIGSTVSDDIPELGNVTWTAAGDYAWSWSQFLYKSVLLAGTDQLNQVYLNSSINYSANVDTNDYNNDPEQGPRAWNVNVNNNPDATGAAIAGLQSVMTNSGSLNVEWANGNKNKNNVPVVIDPIKKTYTWNFNDVNQGDQLYGGVGESLTKYPFTPGFNIHREITTTAPGTQTLIVTVTPQSSPTLNYIYININAPPDSHVVPIITLPTVPQGIGVSLSGDQHYLSINIPNPAAGTPYTFTITITDNFIGASFDYMPTVNVCSQINGPTSGNISGGVTLSDTNLGDWVWTPASGSYLWNSNQNVQYYINLLGSEDKLNNVWVGFNTNYNYNIDGDVFNNGSVSGNENWGTSLNNTPDNSGAPVTGPHVTLDTQQTFDWYNSSPNVLYSAGQWTFSDLGQGDWDSTSVGNNAAVPFTPGFDVTRSIGPLTLSGSKGDTIQQQLLIKVTSKTTIDQLNINVSVWDDGFVIPNITSATYTVNGNPGPAGNINTGSNFVNVGLPNPGIGTVVSLTVNLSTTLKDTYTSINYMPQVQVSQQTNGGGGFTIGDGISNIQNEAGTWGWLASGPYAWKWNKFEYKNVILNGTRRNIANVHFNTNDNAGVYEDSFTNSSFDGLEGWSSGLDGPSIDLHSVNLNLASGFNFDNVNPQASFNNGIYTWDFGSILAGGGTWVNVSMDYTPNQFTFTPGLDASRIVDKTTFTTSDTQILTVSITPRETLPRCNIGVWVQEDQNVDPTIDTSVTSTDGAPLSNIDVSTDGRNMNIYIDNPVVGKTYTYVITIHLRLKAGVTQLEFMPGVNVGSYKQIDSGTVTGTSVINSNTGAGTWTWSSSDSITWRWDQGLTRYVSFQSYSNSSSGDATLSKLTISSGTLTPAFASTTTSYTDRVGIDVRSITVRPTVNESHADIKVNGVTVASGSPSRAINLNVGTNTISIVVTAQDGSTTDTYTIIVTRAR